jgi:trigger factor
VFDARWRCRPEIADIDFKGLELKKTKYRISEEEVDKQLKMMRKNLASAEKIDPPRPVQSGDVVVIDYEGFKDGQPHEPTKTENFVTKVGEGQVVGDLDEGLIGMQAGDEKEIDVSFPGGLFQQSLGWTKTCVQG